MNYMIPNLGFELAFEAMLFKFSNTYNDHSLFLYMADNFNNPLLKKKDQSFNIKPNKYFTSRYFFDRFFKVIRYFSDRSDCDR